MRLLRRGRMASPGDTLSDRKHRSRLIEHPPADGAPSTITSAPHREAAIGGGLSTGEVVTLLDPRVAAATR